MNSQLQPLRRLGALLFVVLTVVFWWILSQGAASVVKAYEHRFEHATVSTDGSTNPPPVASQNGRWSQIRDVTILITTLLAALWAAARFVFPPENFTLPVKGSTPLSGQ